MPFDFQQLANFRLARGSHKQPNKDGNICVNEAAVIVAGFQYREIRDVSCLPDCFSRPVSEYAIYLNDFMMHRVRNELLAPFVTRLPGTSDAPWIEEQRARLIVVETVRRIVAAEYDRLRHEARAYGCRLDAVGSLAEYLEVPAVDHGYNIMSDAADAPDVTRRVYARIAEHVVDATS